jgi:hypothetical protein
MNELLFNTAFLFVLVNLGSLQIIAFVWGLVGFAGKILPTDVLPNLLNVCLAKLAVTFVLLVAFALRYLLWEIGFVNFEPVWAHFTFIVGMTVIGFFLRPTWAD